MNPTTTEPCFAILRVEWGTTTVKLIVWTEEEANQQTARLNGLNEDANCHYHWVISRALRRPPTDVSGP